MYNMFIYHMILHMQNTKSDFGDEGAAPNGPQLRRRRPAERISRSNEILRNIAFVLFTYIYIYISFYLFVYLYT